MTTATTVNKMVARIEILEEVIGMSAAQVAQGLGIKWSTKPTKSVATQVLSKMERALEVMEDEKDMSNDNTAPVEQPVVHHAPVVGVTIEQLNATSAAIVEAINANFGAMLGVTNEQLDALTTRVTTASKYTKALEKRIAYLEKIKTPATQVPVLEAAATIEEGVSKETVVNPEEIIFTDDQIKALDNARSIGGEEEYQSLKSIFVRMNKRMGRTVGNMLNDSARFIEDNGHKGVDTVANLLDQTINAAKTVSHSVIDLGATTLFAANQIGRTAGHIIVNGVVHTLDGAGNIVNSK